MNLKWVWLFAAILGEVTATLSLKGALAQPLLYVVAVLGYLLAFGALARTLRAGMPLGTTYGIWAACGVALTTVLSLLLFGEPITLVMALGIVLVIAGVLCVELGGAERSRNSAESAQTAAAPGEIPNTGGVSV